MQFLPDIPVAVSTDDKLGLKTFVEDLYSAVVSAQPPFVFGVLGDWGTGKTSALHLMREKLVTQHHLVPIWFDAWRYENETNILYPLLHAIKKAHEKYVPSQKGSFQEAFVEIVGASAFALGDVFLKSITKRLIDDAIGLEDLEGHIKRAGKHKDAITRALEGWSNEISKLREAFTALLHAFAKDVESVSGVSAGNVRFIILIDDLDRCLPDTTIRLLESIKNHLDAPNAIFVLALNASVIYQGIRHKYGNVDVNGREYLEKILNFSFYVPAPNVDMLATFVEGWLNQVNGSTGVDRRNYFREFAQSLRDCRFNNPRKIKRVVNRYIMFLNRSDTELARFRLGSLARLLMLAEYFPDVFQIVRDYIEFKESSNSSAAFVANEFFTYYLQQVGSSIFNRYPQLAIMRNLFELRETTNKIDKSLRLHAAEVYQLTRLV